MPCFSYPLLLATLGERLDVGSSTTIIGVATDFIFFFDFTDLKDFTDFRRFH